MRKLIKSAAFIGVLAFSQMGWAAGNAGNGEKLAAVCAACHGPDGNSPAPAFPKIAGLGEKYLYKQMKDMANKDPKKPTRTVVEMTGLLDNFSDSDLHDIAAWYASQTLQLSGAKNISVKLNSGALLEGAEALSHGEKLYRAGNSETGIAPCSGCHSPQGNGNSPAGYPRLAGQYADYLEKQLKAFQAGERTNDEASIMRTISANMSGAEMSAVANYIAGLQ